MQHLKTSSADLVRQTMVDRINWLSAIIAKNEHPDRLHQYVDDLQATTAALKDLVTVPPAMPPHDPRAGVLKSFLEQRADALKGLCEMMESGAGNGSAAHKFVRKLHAFVSDPAATAI